MASFSHPHFYIFYEVLNSKEVKFLIYTYVVKSLTTNAPITAAS